jgi:hypothetical protein
MIAIWFEEHGTTTLWHRAERRSGRARYATGCGAQMRLREIARVWPQKAGEIGPPSWERCSQCVRRRTAPRPRIVSRPAGAAVDLPVLRAPSLRLVAGAGVKLPRISRRRPPA